MKLALRRPPVVVAAFAVGLAAVCADNLDKNWDNGAGNNDFANATNWNANSLPTTGLGAAGDRVRVDLAGANRAVYSATLDNPGAGATSAQAGVFQRLQIADVSGNGELEIIGGVFRTDGASQSTIGSSGRAGVLTVNGAGAIVSLGGWVALGHGTSGTGTVNVVNGSFTSGRDGTVGGIPRVSIALGNGNNARGALRMFNGHVATRSGVLLGAPGTTGAGRFEVWGGGVAAIGAENAADDGFWLQSSNSVLAAYVTDGSLGGIYVVNRTVMDDGVYADGNVIFMPGARLEVAFAGATNAGSWDVMRWEGTLLTNGLSFAASVTDTNWSFAFADTDGVNGPDTLRVTYSAGPPRPPAGLVAVPGDERAALRWSALAGATHYTVKRSTTSGGPYAPVAASIASTSFTDTGLVNGVTYYYVLSASTADGESLNSHEVRATPRRSQFVHPGVMHTQADLDRMRTKVEAGEEPWLAGFRKLVADPRSSFLYPMRGPFPVVTRAGAGASSVNLSQWEDDCGAAYQNALMWYLTGNPAHASKAIQILDAWAGTLTNINGSDARLTAGLQGHKFITAAEILRHTGAPWPPARVNAASHFIRSVLLPLNRMHGGGNWGSIGAVSQMAAAVFLEDEAEFNAALAALKFGSPTQCDMGIANYIHPIGWTTEADRDIGHWALGLNNLAAGAQIAWCQGVDLWSFLNYRIHAGHEYLARYNAGNAVPYERVRQCDGLNSGAITTIGRGRWDIVFYEQTYHPHANLFGVASPWMWMAVTNTRAWMAGTDGIAAEGYCRDHVGFGTLVAALPERRAGLPGLPTGLTAAWSNHVVRLSWNAAPNALTYNVKRATSRGGPYTNLATGLAATTFTDTTAANDHRWFYKVSAVNAAGETENSGLVSAHPSAHPPAPPTGVTARPTSHQRIDLAWNASEGAVSYNVKRAFSPGGPYLPVAANVGAHFLTFADTGLPSGITFYYVVTANNAIGASGDSAESAATTLPALPAPWTYADAGYLTTPGHATFASGVFTVRAAGLDYSGFGNSDSFGFAHTRLAGDGAIVARYASREIYSRIGKTGLTMRESLDDESRHMTVFVSDDTASMIFRNSTGGNASHAGSTPVSGLALPLWLKLNRAGNVFTGSVSADGANWTVINTRTNTMASTLLAGLAVCSRNNGFLDTGVFDNVAVTGVWPPPVATNPVPLVVTADGGSLRLSWPSTHTGWRLEKQTNSLSAGLGTNWFTVPGSILTNQMTMSVGPASPVVFFRLAYP